MNEKKYDIVEFDSSKLYITLDGYNNLEAEYKTLKFRERPAVLKTVAWAASNGDRSENADYQYGKKKLREIDKRLGFLSLRLDQLIVLPMPATGTNFVRFGATVTIRDEEDKEFTYTIVGIDEVNVALGRISYRSPIGSALLNAKSGDIITYESPQGKKELEVLEVQYNIANYQKS
jgi:transcription elongation factor GreB